MSYAPTRSGSAGRPRGGSGLRTALSQIAARFGYAIVTWTNRRAVFRLASLEDRHLRDIGLSRADIHWALSQPWHVDPSIALAERVSTRRAATHWASRFDGKTRCGA